MRDDKGQNRGFGFVKFVNAQEAYIALAQVHGKVWCGWMEGGSGCGCVGVRACLPVRACVRAQCAQVVARRGGQVGLVVLGSDCARMTGGCACGERGGGDGGKGVGEERRPLQFVLTVYFSTGGAGR